MIIEKNNSKIVFSWTLYDWANAVYSLVISTTIFPLYYSTIVGSDKVDFFGTNYEPDALYSYSITFSFFIVALSSPILSSIADTMGNKKNFLKFFCYMGSLSCVGLFFFDDVSMIKYGLTLNVISSVGFWGSLVFYNSYLPEIVTEDKLNSVSAKGYMMGYFGSALLLIICLIFIQVVANDNNRLFYTKLSFVFTGCWWFGFAQIAFMNLPNIKKEGKIQNNIIQNSFKSIKNVGQELFKINKIKYFLISLFFSYIGIHTIFYMAVLFGKKEINLDDSILITIILVIQMEAIIGAYLCAILAKKIGNIKVLILCIGIWAAICCLGYYLDKTDPNVKTYFYIAAGIVGLIIGGIQTVARATYSKMLPDEDREVITTYFSFYDVLEKIAIIIGTFVYGYLINITGNMKYSILAMSVSFFISLLIMFKVHLKDK